MEYTQLEQRVLDWMAEHVNIPNLDVQIRRAVPTEREHTGVGTYTRLSVSSGTGPIKAGSPINGPAIDSPEIEHGGAALLFLDDSGNVDTLEMFACGDYFNEKTTEFELTEWESNKITEP